MTQTINSLAVSPNGRFLVAGTGYAGLGCVIRLWELESGQEIWTTEEHIARVNAVAFSPDGQFVLCGSGDSARSARTGKSVEVGAALKLCDVNSGKEIRNFDAPDKRRITCAAFTPDGERVISGSGAALVLWDVESGKALRQFVGHSRGVECMAIASNGRLVSGSDDGTVRLWEVDTGRNTASQELDGSVRSVAFSPSGQLVVTACGSTKFDYLTLETQGSIGSALQLWEAPSLRLLHQLDSGGDIFEAVAFSPDGQLIASAQDNKICLWEVETGKKLHVFRNSGFEHSGIRALTFSHDGSYVIAGGSRNKAWVWNVKGLRRAPPKAGERSTERSWLRRLFKN